MIEAIAGKYRTGSPWRELPERFGPWQTAYERLTRWSADDTWATLLARAQADADAAGGLDWPVAADSTMVQVHQHGASARRVGGNAATARAGDREVGIGPPERAGLPGMTRIVRRSPPSPSPPITPWGAHAAARPRRSTP